MGYEIWNSDISECFHNKYFTYVVGRHILNLKK